MSTESIKLIQQHSQMYDLNGSQDLGETIQQAHG
jgi:hypothetical protein